MMIKIDICDDEQFWIDKAREIISDYYKGRQEIEFDYYTSSEDFVNKTVKNKEFADIVILDIDMNGSSGFKTAKLLKEVNPDVILIFFTCHDQYVFESFSFQPFRYILKANCDKELKESLDAAIEIINNQSIKKVTLKGNDETLYVFSTEIVYFETANRRCDVHLKSGKIISIRKTIKQLLLDLDDPDFVLIHSGAVVNVRYIKGYSSYYIILDNNEKLIISRNHIKAIKLALTRFWGSRV